MSLNLSALAVRERAITLFLIILLAAAGVYAFVKLGRAEDPSFTIKTLTVTAVWPGATAQEMQDLVAEPLEKGCRSCAGTTASRPSRGRVRLHDRDAQGQHAAIRGPGGVLPGPQEARRRGPESARGVFWAPSSTTNIPTSPSRSMR